MEKVLVIIPAYNEQENIGKILDEMTLINLQSEVDVLIIDDGSKDKTVEIIKEKGYKVISHFFNMGYGAALQTGYKYALEFGYDYVLQLDGDGQHDLSNIANLKKKLGCGMNDGGEYPDIVIGSRFLEGSQSFPISSLKKIAISFFSKVIKEGTGYNLTDPTSGLQGLNRKAFSFYASYGNFDLKYPDMNMIIQMILLGYKIDEIPAVMHPRMAGVSMHTGIVKIAKYMLLMMLSSMNVYIRCRKKNGK